MSITVLLERSSSRVMQDLVVVRLSNSIHTIDVCPAAVTVLQSGVSFGGISEDLVGRFLRSHHLLLVKLESRDRRGRLELVRGGLLVVVVMV